jgi:hypothetical protein
VKHGSFFRRLRVKWYSEIMGHYVEVGIHMEGDWAVNTEIMGHSFYRWEFIRVVIWQ